MSNYFTLFAMSGVGVPPYSARGITQVLEPIPQASQLARTVNGTLLDISDDAFFKYQSTVSCNDQLAPSVDGKWPGQVVTVDCVSELCYLTEGGSASRTVVSGSSRVEGDYTYYRPQLTMLVRTFSMSTDEYGAAVNWSMQLEEQ